MRQNNYIPNRYTQNDFSSYKIRQPLNEQSYGKRSKYEMECEGGYQNAYQKQINYGQRSFSNMYDKYNDLNCVGLQRQNSREMSYNSKGSNTSKNKVKMADYVACQARNLIQNRDKFKYDQQSHMRSSSLQNYPTTFKVSRGINYQNLEKDRQQTQNKNLPSQIPSFGVYHRPTIPGQHNYKRQPSFDKYALNPFKIQDPSKSRHNNRENYISTQTNDRTQKLQCPSTSSKQKQKHSHPKAIDSNRIQNMDRINVKIKNILITLEEQESQYREKFDDSYLMRRVRTDDQIHCLNGRGTHRCGKGGVDMQYKYGRERTHLGKSLSKHHGNFANNNISSALHEDTSFLNNRSSRKQCQNNTSSYYYYEDESAILKSSQSPFKQSPERSFKSFSVQKQKFGEKRQMTSIEKQTLVRRCLHFKTVNNILNRECNTGQSNRLEISPSKNIPECQTQIVDSKAIEQSDQNRNSNLYSCQNYSRMTVNELNYSRFCENYRTPELYQIQDHPQKKQEFPYHNQGTAYFPSSINQKQATFERVSEMMLKDNRPYINKRDSNNKDNISVKGNHIKTNLIYFNPDQQQKHLKSNTNYRPDQHPQNHTNIRHQQMNRKQSLNKRVPVEAISYPFQSRSVNKNEQLWNGYNKSTSSCFDNTYHQAFNDHQGQSQARCEQSYSREMKVRGQKEVSYSDEIRQTPRVEGVRCYDRPKMQGNRFPQVDSQQGRNYQLQSRLKQYQKRLSLYQKQMSTSKIFDSEGYNQKLTRLSISPRRQLNLKTFISQAKSIQMSKSKSKNNQYSSSRPRDFHLTREAQTHQIKQVYVTSFKDEEIQSGKNTEKRLDQLRNQRLMREIEQKHNKQRIYPQLVSDPRPVDSGNQYRIGRNYTSTTQQQKCYEQSNISEKGTNFRFQPMSRQTPTKLTSRKARQFGKDQNKNLIQSLKRERQEAAMMSKRKSRINHSTSVDFARLQGLQQRSESNNSRASFTTIIKGKDIDAEILKIQHKMLSNQRMKEQMIIQSHQNTQLSKVIDQKKGLVQQFQIPPRRHFFAQQCPKTSEARQLSHINQQIIRPPSLQKTSYPTTATQLLKSLTQQNSFVKVKKHIIKQQKASQIKSYLQDQIQRHSGKSESLIGRQQSIKSIKSKNSSNKQNILPLTTTTIESPKYSNGGKKVVLGLAENLASNCLQLSNVTINGAIRSDVNTPKLLRNLRNKLCDKSILQKKAQKRGFRYQFINNLHEDNEVLSSATKCQDTRETDDLMNSTERVSPEHKQILNKILNMLEQQILIDQQFRNDKKWFNSLAIKDKWPVLLSQFMRIVSQDQSIQLTQIMQIFTLTQQQSNPFYSTRGVSSTLQSLIKNYLQCQQKWSLFTQYMSTLSSSILVSCGISQKNLDVQRKGSIQIEDLTRFINMQLNKYYRQRDLWLIWQKIVSKKLQNPGRSAQCKQNNRKLDYQQFVIGLGLTK